MFRNFLKITIRNMLKHKGFSAINVAGLAMGISLCLVIILFLRNELDSDGFNTERDRIFRVVTTDSEIDYSYIRGWATSPAVLGPMLEEEFPGVELSTRLWKLHGNVLEDTGAVPVSGFYAEPSFFEVFDFTLSTGDPATALLEPYSVVLSRQSAERLFGGGQVLGKVVEVESCGQFTVTGILDDPPLKSHIRFDMLTSFATLGELTAKGGLYCKPEDWNSYHSCYNYIMLSSKAYADELGPQLAGLEGRIFPEEERARFDLVLQPLSRINLGWNLVNPMPGTKHSMEIVFVPFIAAIILALACFNYVNLSVSRALRRAREIGLRKVVGADRRHVIAMFLGESLLVTLISLAVACVLVVLVVPRYNGLSSVILSKSTVNLDLMRDASVYGWFLALALLVSLMAGIYPAVYLSSFRPVEALRGMKGVRPRSRYLLRKVIIGTQFGVCMIAVITILFIQKQFSFMRSVDRGYAVADFASLNLRDADYATVREELLRDSDITGVCATSGVPGHEGHWSTDVVDMETDREFRAYYYSADEHFIGDFGLELLAGRGFSEDHATDRQDAVVINEKALSSLGSISPAEAVGRRVSIRGKELKVIGVLKDFHYSSIDNPVNPLFITADPGNFRYADISFVPGSGDRVREYVSSVWQSIDPVHKVNLRFDSEIRGEIDDLNREVIGLVAGGCGVIVLIAALGLLGMTSYSMELKVREIGVRKVMGAGVSRLVGELTSGMLAVVLIASAGAVPLAYLLNGALLQNFPFRVALDPVVFVSGVFLVLAIALLTITSQTVRAALDDPVKVLREE